MKVCKSSILERWPQVLDTWKLSDDGQVLYRDCECGGRKEVLVGKMTRTVSPLCKKCIKRKQKSFCGTGMGERGFFNR